MYAHSEVAGKRISLPNRDTMTPPSGTKLAKYIGRTAARIVVAKAELAKSYIAHPNISRRLDLSISIR